MAKRLKYCEKWRPCSDTLDQSRASTASRRWSNRPDWGENFSDTLLRQEGAGLGPSPSAKWAQKTMSLETACRTSALGHSSRYSEKRPGWEKSMLLLNQARVAAEQRRCWLRNSYKSVAPQQEVPRRDFLVWKPTLNRKAEASLTVVMASSSCSWLSFSP